MNRIGGQRDVVMAEQQEGRLVDGVGRAVAVGELCSLEAPDREPEEIAQRERAGLPPFGRMAALIVSGKDRVSAETHARALVRAAHSSCKRWLKWLKKDVHMRSWK